MLIAFLCLRYRLAGAYFALATFAFAQMFLLVVQNLDFLRKTEGFNIPILPRGLLVDAAVRAGQRLYFWIPLGHPGAGPGRHHRVRRLAAGSVLAGHP